MASENETVEAVKKRMLKWADKDIHEVGRDVLRRQAQQFASDFESACRREKAELDRKVADALTTGAFVAEESARKPRRNCDTIADFHDAKRKFKDENAKGRANYFRRLCHWLLAPVAEGGES